MEERGGLPYVDVRVKGDWAAKEPLRQSFLFDMGADCNMISTQTKTAWEQEKVPLQTNKVRSEISSLMGGNLLCKEVVSLLEGIEFSVVDIPFDGVVGLPLPTSWLEERKETSEEEKDFSLVKTLPDGRLSICNNTFDISKVKPYRCPHFKRNGTDHKIIGKIVKECVASGITDPINPSQAVIVQGIFLIDKQARSQASRIYYDDDRDLKRYKLVLDCRAINALKRIEFGFKVEKPLVSHASKVGNVETKQSQVAAAAQLSTVEVKNRRYKILLDIALAFYSISMEENPRSLFCFE